MPSADADATARLRFAVEAARAAGELALFYYRRVSLRIDSKSDGTPVTEADREAESLLRREILAAFPRDGLLGEEHGETPGTSGYRWILDPIDGTKAFIRGVPLWGGLIAAVQGERARIGVIEMPALAESAWAGEGTGAFQRRAGSEPRPARVSPTEELSAGLLCVSAIETYKEMGLMGTLAGLAGAAREARGWSDAYAHLLVATGRADVAIEPRVSPWDVAPLQVILAEAGGKFTDWSGADSIWTGSCVSSNGRVHAQTLGLLRR